MSKATGKLRQDKFYRLAKERGYRSRAAIKLLQIDRRFSFLPAARAVLDLGAAPGGWLQVAVSSAAAGALVVGVDLKPIWPIRGARLLREDIAATSKCSAAVRRLMKSRGVTAFDVVLHDGDGKNRKRRRDGAHKETRHSALVIDAVRLATTFLAPKGTFITKFIGSQDLNAIMFCLKQLFENVQLQKPMASRTASAETYFVCLEYKAPAKIQPELFDLNHLLAVSQENKPRDEVRYYRMETELRGICRHGSIPLWKPCPASEFIWSEAEIPLELAGSFMALSFDDPASLPIKNHELTTLEIRQLCESLNLLDKNSLNHVLKWRTSIRKVLSSCSQVTPKVDVTAMDARVKDDDQHLDKKEELASIIDRKTRRDKRQISCRANDKAHKTMGKQMDATEDSCCNADIFSFCGVKDGEELRAVDSAELYMEDGIRDTQKEETLTHEGSDEEMDSDEEQHRYDPQLGGMVDETYGRFVIKNAGDVKQHAKVQSESIPYTNADLLEGLLREGIGSSAGEGQEYQWV